MVASLKAGQAQGFHVDYFPKGHGPTDFERWANAATHKNASGTAKGRGLGRQQWLRCQGHPHSLSVRLPRRPLTTVMAGRGYGRASWRKL